MAADERLIARHEETRSSDPGPTTTRLPTELISDQLRRLAVFATIGLAVWSFAFVLDLVLLPWLEAGWQTNWRAVGVETAGVLGSAAVSLYLWRAPGTHEAKCGVGIAVMLMHATLIAVMNAWALDAPAAVAADIGRPSWTALLIVIYAMIAPSTPRQLLLASLVAAVLDPLAYGIAALAGVGAPSAVQLLVMTWPSVACAFIAVVPAKIIQRLGRRLREAQALGSYRLVEKLEQGGMGEVWRAEHSLLARNAAIKLVRPEVLGARTDVEAQTVLRRFEREAQATAGLGSPHSIQVFDFGITREGTFYYVMELLAGRNLETLVRDFGPLPADRAVFLLRQVCHSLADAHARGLVHRDIKPANIHVGRMGLDYDFVKVLDFGLVKFGDPSLRVETLTTLDHRTSGTPAYMAPETILGEDVDRRADVYALGCVAYFALTGQLVFEAENSMKLLLQHLHATPIRPSERTELPIPPQLEDLILACLEKDPANRPQDAGELFQLALGCRDCDTWTQARAAAWWRLHVPQLAGSLEATTGRRATGATEQKPAGVDVVPV
jgi:serine/threonine-protein kinase